MDGMDKIDGWNFAIETAKRVRFISLYHSRLIHNNDYLSHRASDSGRNEAINSSQLP
jgi:hypothetical protein